MEKNPLTARQSASFVVMESSIKGTKNYCEACNNPQFITMEINGIWLCAGCGSE